MANPTIQTLAADLAAGRTSSRTLTEEALARISDPAGEGKRAFIKVWREQALAAADASDTLRKAGVVPSPLAGIPVSIKNLCNVAGETTLAGSKALDDAPPATADAPVVARLRAAGAVIVGSTNMSEFAFSGVGYNPHYGTPRNAFDRAATHAEEYPVTMTPLLRRVSPVHDEGPGTRRSCGRTSVRARAVSCSRAGFTACVASSERSAAGPMVSARMVTLSVIGMVSRPASS
mgnify:CR=1 FL=1